MIAQVLKTLTLTSFFAFSTLGLAGCTAASSLPPEAEATNTEAGTGDSGGGNSYKGRPLESYIRDPRKLPAYTDELESRLAKLDTVDPQFGRLLRSGLTEKTWYLLPGSLKALPSEKIGAAVPTDQVALQDFESVWIDNDILSKMNLEDQARMILHEMLMAVKILKLQSRKTQCLALAIRRSLCDHEDKTPRGKLADLGTADYNQIRRVTVYLFDQPFASLDQNDKAGVSEALIELEDTMAQNDFSFRLKKFFVRKEANFGSSYDEIEALMLNTYHDGLFNQSWFKYDWAELRKQNPDVNFSEGTPRGLLWKSSGHCSVGRSFRSDRPEDYGFTVMPQGAVGQSVSRSSVSVGNGANSAGYGVGGLSLLGWDRVVYHILDPQLKFGENPQTARHFMKLSFHPVGFRIHGLSVTEEEYVTDPATGSPSLRPKAGGIADNCALEPQIQH